MQVLNNYSFLLPYLLDAVLIAVFAYSIYYARKRGFLVIVISYSVTLAVLILCRMYASGTSATISRYLIHDRMQESITEKISDGIDDGRTKLSECLPGYLAVFADSDSTKEITEKSINDVSEKITDSAEENVIIPMLTYLIYFLAYTLSKTVIKLLKFPAKMLTKLPIAKQTDRLLGAILGISAGAIRVILIVMLMVVAASFVPGTAFSDAVAKSELFRIIVTNL